MKYIYLSILTCATLWGKAQTTSHLPIILLDTKGQNIVDEPKITAELKIIYKGLGQVNTISDAPNVYNGNVGIEFRGSTSQTFPKKPYGFETRNSLGEDNDVSLLGMPEESDWTLNASYNDKSLMRDGLAYILAGSIMEYAPRVRYNELWLNGNYQGVYLLIEKIKRDKNRVDISKLEPKDDTGDDLTGGYILKMDKFSGSNNGVGWNSPFKPYSGAVQNTYFQVEYPKDDDITYEQISYIKNHITNIENIIAGPEYKDTVNGYRKYIDTKSLMDYIIINELTKNPDAYRLSTFFYKDKDSKGGKIKFGPAWDYNLGFGNVDYCTQGNTEGLVILNFNTVCPQDGWVIHFWWKKFLEDEVFYESLKHRWKSLRAGQLSNDRLEVLTDSLANLIGAAQTRNFAKWPILGNYVWPNYYVGTSYQAEVDWLKNWIKSRVAYLDKVWEIKTTNTDDSKSSPLTVTPNPTTSFVNIHMSNELATNSSFYLQNTIGRSVPISELIIDGQNIQFNMSHLPAGFYIFSVKNDKNIYSAKIQKRR